MSGIKKKRRRGGREINAETQRRQPFGYAQGPRRRGCGDAEKDAETQRRQPFGYAK